MSDFGGRAMCPRDDYSDAAIREEMVWHALEEAMRDADLDPPAEGGAFWPVYEAKPWEILGIGTHFDVTVPRGRVCFRATTDDHLGQDASGLVDVTATLVTA